ncbi:MAG: MFS transporter [Myxococcales bacterium]|nr:MFS transporter [Myxococcales bacterium]MCB9641787.1 MFS transporter [Myxococcales bacterium]
MAKDPKPSKETTQPSSQVRGDGQPQAHRVTSPLASQSLDPIEKNIHTTTQDTLILFLVSAATMLVMVVFTVPLTTLESTAKALDAGLGARAWLLSAMPLGAASGLLGSSTLGDRWGRRMIFLWGLVILTVSSAIAAISPSSLVFIFARIAQGLGGAAVFSCGLGLLAQTFSEGRARTKATAVWAAALGAGVAVGPIFAAIATKLGGWAWAHGGCALVAVALFLGSRLTLTKEETVRGGRVDWLGAVFFMVSLALMMSGLAELRLGWDRPSVVLLLGGGAALLGVFFSVESRQREPMLELSLFRNAEFTGATIAAFTSGAGILALMTLVPMFLSQAMGIQALSAAFVLCFWSATSIPAALAARWLPDELSPRVLLVGGLVSCAGAQLLLLGPSADSTPLRFVPGLLVAGIANGLLNAALGRQAVATVPQEHAALGSGVNNTARYFGSAIGITLGVILLAHGKETGGQDGLFLAWGQVVMITTGFSILGALGVAAAKHPQRETAHPNNPSEAQSAL